MRPEPNKSRSKHATIFYMLASKKLSSLMGKILIHEQVFSNTFLCSLHGLHVGNITPWLFANLASQPLVD